HESIAAVKKGFEDKGGKITAEIVVPLEANDFSPYLQRIRDQSPECTFVFMPLGPMSVSFVKSYTDRGLLKDGIKLYGQSETAEFDLPSLGDAALGVETAQVYGPSLDNPVNKAFVESYQKKYNKVPSVIALLGFDGMHIMYEMIKATDGKVDGE